MEVQLIDEYIVKSLTDYGREVNTKRQLASLQDGLKMVYRRVMYTAMNTSAATKFTKTAAIAGNTIATVHPHSSDSVCDVISQMVRWGLLSGQGNHGMKLIYGSNIMPSAPRYTEAMVDPKWYKIFSNLMKYVPYNEAEIEGNVEPEYLPTPIPMILLFSGNSISYGVNARYPMFTAKSLYKAYINNDPNLLESPGGLTINKSESELDSLWNKGLGRVCYEYKVEKQFLDSGDGVMISGSAELFKPMLDIGFTDERDKGQIYILDQTAGDIPQVFIGRSPYVRAIDQDEIYNRCKILCKQSKSFRLTVTDGKQVFVIPMKDWIDYTYNNYLDLIEKYKQDKISKLEFEFRVYKWLPKVAEYLLNDRNITNEEIESKINDSECDLKVIETIMRKSINTLRYTDSTAKLDQISNSIKEFKSIDSTKFVENVIDEF